MFGRMAPDLPQLLATPSRQFKVELRSHKPGTSLCDDAVFNWAGSATDEADAVSVALAAAKRAGLLGITSYRVVEDVSFLPVELEGKLNPAV